MKPAFPTPPTAPASDAEEIHPRWSILPTTVLDVSGTYRERVAEGRVRGR
jgi:hypothetical protein